MASVLAARAARLIASKPRVFFRPSIVRSLTTATCPSRLLCQTPQRFDKYSHLPVRSEFAFKLSAARFASVAAGNNGKPDPDALVQEGQKNLAQGNTREAWGAHDDAGAVGNPGLIRKYGLVPTALLGLAAAVSKEILILDEHIVVAFCFGTFVFAAYTYLGDAIGKSLDDQSAAIRAEHEAIIDARIAMMEENLKAHKNAANIMGILTDVRREYTSLVDSYATAISARFQYNTLKYVERKLQEFADAENDMKNRIANNIINRSTAYVQQRIRDGDAKLKDSFFNAAVSRLEGRPVTSGDPIRQLYNEYFQRIKQKQKELYSKKIKLSAAQIEVQKEEYRKLVARVKDDVGVTLSVDNIPIKTELQMKYKM